MVPHKVYLFNNLHRKKEEFIPQIPGEVRFYSCGPTTYDFLHVGNARALVVGDLVHRILKGLDYKVIFTRNFTDVDDKIIARAQELKVSPLEHADRFVKECQLDMNYLGMMPATFTPKVSETMDEIILMIEELIKNKFAYVVEGEVLYNVPLFKEYGKLSKKDLESLQHGIRVEVEDHKKNPADFVLWKPVKEGEAVFWDSPWGKGRPGWHIECSAMARKYMGVTIDLHHGGVDLMFPHHENEIAQSEGANGKEFCKHWCHNEFLNFGSEKMSKSLGNVVTIRQFVLKFSGAVLRHALASVHYRSKMDWSDEVIEKAIHDVARIHQFVFDLATVKNSSLPLKKDQDLSEIKDTVLKMKEELAQDFNVPGALGHFFFVIRFFNREFVAHRPDSSCLKLLNEIVDFVRLSTGLISDDAQKTLNEIVEIKKRQNTGQKESLSNSKIEEAILSRKEAKEKKDWALADKIRSDLLSQGIVIKDNPDGSTSWSYK